MTPSSCNDIQLSEALELLDINLAKINKWVNGTENETVNLGGKNTDTIRRLVNLYVRIASRTRLGLVRIGGGLDIDVTGLLSLAIQTGTGLVFDNNGALAIDFSQMPTDKFENMLKALRLPLWLARNTSFYVRPDGKDTNNGLSNTAAGAFKTIQGGLNSISANYNMGPYRAILNVAAGTYAPFNLPKYNSSTGRIDIVGAGASTIVSATDATAVNSTEAAGVYTIQNMSIIGSKTAERANGFYLTAANIGVQITYVNVSFYLTEQVRPTTGALPVVACYGGASTIGDGCTITCNGLPDGSNTYAMYVNGGKMELHGDLVVNGLCNTVCQCIAGSTWSRSITILPIVTGNVQGKRYYANLNAIITTSGGGATYFPGTTDGTTSTGGQYA